MKDKVYVFVALEEDGERVVPVVRVVREEEAWGTVSILNTKEEKPADDKDIDSVSTVSYTREYWGFWNVGKVITLPACSESDDTILERCNGAIASAIESLRNDKKKSALKEKLKELRDEYGTDAMFQCLRELDCELSNNDLATVNGYMRENFDMVVQNDCFTSKRQVIAALALMSGDKEKELDGMSSISDSYWTQKTVVWGMCKSMCGNDKSNLFRNVYNHFKQKIM